MGEPRLTGRLVTLRPLREEDMARRVQWTNDPEIHRKTIGVEVDPRTEEDLRRWWATLQQDPRSEQWAVELPEAGYVGDLDLHGINPVAREAWVIPFMGDPRARDPQVLADALQILAHHAREELGIERLMVEALDQDQETIQVLRDLGFDQIDAIDNLNGTYSLIFQVETSLLDSQARPS